MIGIFGDSFGYQFVKEAPSWPNYLGKHYKEEVENFSLFATAINYSYERFIHKMDTEPNRYSKIVFVCTEPHRQTFRDNNRKQEIAYAGRDAKETVRFNKECTEIKPHFMQQDITKNEEEAIKGYHIWDSMFPNTFEYVRDAVERVVKSYPNTLVLHTEQLSKITELDMGSPADFVKYSEKSERSCHMSAVQNKELSEYIIKYFEEGFNIHEVFKNTNQYFTKSNTIEEAGLILNE